MNQIIPLLTAFGLGTIVAAIVQAWLNNRSKSDDRRFQEKQTAHIGLLEAYHRAAVEGTDETSRLFAYWQMRCELVGSKPVREAIQKAHAYLKLALRADLGITK